MSSGKQLLAAYKGLSQELKDEYIETLYNKRYNVRFPRDEWDYYFDIDIVWYLSSNEELLNEFCSRPQVEYLETKCGCQIIINSREHDECRCDGEGENWICADCYDGEYDESDDEETEVDVWEELKEEDWTSNLFNSMEAFGEWFDENIKSLEECEAEGLDFESEMKKWCENNNHDYNDYNDTRRIGVYNNNVKRIWDIKIEK